jgi:hypothetical protein
MARISAATPAIDKSRAGKIYHYPFRFFLDHCVKRLCHGRRNVQIDIAFKRQDIRAVLTRHRSGWVNVFSHSIPPSSLHHPLGVSLRENPQVCSQSLAMLPFCCRFCDDFAPRSDIAPELQVITGQLGQASQSNQRRVPNKSLNARVFRSHAI